MSYSAISAHYRAKSAAVLVSLETRLDRILVGWLIIAGFATALRMVTGPIPLAEIQAQSIAPYLLLVFAPVASILLALRWFRDGPTMPQPMTRMAVVGQWRAVPPVEARRHKLYGTSGIMVSLLIGMLLNVPIRAMEYFASMPPITGAAPHWLATLHLAMTFDVVLFTSLYAIAFVAALRRVPLFPRLLAAIWVCDIGFQLLVANVVVAAGVPTSVSSALHGLLDGNVKKVLISAAIWLPYLLLSTRVNVTYRSRVPA